jgi:hypothetical protein
MMTEMKEQNRRRIKRLVEACTKAIRAQQMQGHESILFSALLSRRSKKLNSIERAAVDNASRLLRDYINSEDPDKVRVELRGERDELLWSKTFSLEVDDGPVETGVPSGAVFQGLGEAELGELVNAKIQEMRRQDELRDLRVQRDQLEQENEQLRRQLDEAEESLEAKKSIEYYSGIIGIALPGLARMLSGSPLGSTLGMLAGMGADAGAQQSGGDESSLMIEEIGQFTRSLDHQQLAKLYMVVVELSNNRELIGSVLSYITGLDHKHAKG